MRVRHPTQEELLAARDKTVPDVIASQLKVLFVGINPGLYSAAVGHHFARPGNRFWPALHTAGFTERLLSPWEDQKLLSWGYGITNIVDRATASATELSATELVEGGKRLQDKVRCYHPHLVAMLGVGAYRAAFGRPKAVTGRQPQVLVDETEIWVLPNPSGLNAHYSLADLVRVFKELWAAVEGGAHCH
jgi:double-stranded uracil-DNA glycosylase